LRFALLAGALAHFLEAVVDEVQLQLVLVLDDGGIQAKHAHFLEQKTHAAGVAEVAGPW
jgi:hypothetical protein